MNKDWFVSNNSSANGSCVEVRFVDDLIQVRNSYLAENSAVLTFNKSEWLSFIDGVKKNEFEIE